MPKIDAFRCDSCNKIIESERDVYKLDLKGARWLQPDVAGGPSEPMQKVKHLGFCEACARDIAARLKRIAERV